MKRIFIVFFLLMTIQSITLSQQPFIGSSIYCPVLVSGCGGSGSGFYWRRDSILYFITAAHVLFKDTTLFCDTIILHSQSTPSKNSEDKKFIDLRSALKNGKLKRHLSHDVAVLYIANIQPNGFLNQAKYAITITSSDSGLANINTFLPFKEVSISNDVFLLGYPTSIGIPNIPQLDYSQPLLRKGIVAGKNLINNTIIIDCPSYQGNSGGPVVEIDQNDSLVYTYRLIGILVAYIPFAETWKNLNYGWENFSVSNSGYSVVEPIDYARDLTKLIH
jgi:hypothetical protein